MRWIADSLVSTSGGTHELHGVTVPLGHDRIDETIKQRFLTGEYESEERWLVEKHLQKDIDIVELGGGLGYLSCFFDHWMARGQKQIVVEADEQLISIIKQTREMNDCDFTVLNRAYFPGEEEVGFDQGDLVTTGAVAPEEEENQIKTTSLREIVDEYDISEFSLIVDIEGAEVALVDEELELLIGRCRMLIIEYHHPKQRRDPWIESQLLNAGFVHCDDSGSVFVYENSSLTPRDATT